MAFDDLYPPPSGHIPVTSVAPKRAHGDVEGVARGGKGSPVYLAHSYPTKVPPEAVAPFIAHYTRPGDLVCDPFAGSGMTGVAARRLGRNAVLSDLSPLAVHLATNVTIGCNIDRVREAARSVLADLAESLADWYRTQCTACGGRARLDWLLWGDTVACPSCSQPLRLWDAAFDHEAGVMTASDLRCEWCAATFTKGKARVLESAPVWASTTCLNGCGRTERPALHSDAVLAATIDASKLTDWYPDVALGRDREMYIRSALELHGVHRVADFYTGRNLRALAKLWARIEAWPDPRTRQVLAFAFTNTAWHGTRMRRFNARGGQRPLTGTLYIPQMSVEVNVASVFSNKVAQIVRFYASEDWTTGANVNSRVASAANLDHLDDDSVDYVFTDPPFGSNIFYADCAVIAESWLGALTNVREEAVVNRSLSPSDGGKTVEDYARLMTGSFCEVARVLKAGGTATVVFQNTDPHVWQALEDALATAGLSCERADTLDKGQQSHKGYKGRSGAENVAAFDIILTVRHRQLRGRRPTATRRADAVSVLRDHLLALPVVGEFPPGGQAAHLALSILRVARRPFQRRYRPSAARLRVCSRPVRGLLHCRRYRSLVQRSSRGRERGTSKTQRGDAHQNPRKVRTCPRLASGNSMPASRKLSAGLAPRARWMKSPSVLQ